MKLEEIYQLYKAHPVVTTDTRNCPEGSMFFALKGERFNGNEFAAQALEAGCAYAVIDEPVYNLGDRYILVDDVLKTLQDLAHYHRMQLRIPVVGITGTNGKTTTKELVSAVLSTKYNTLYTQGNFNNHIGVPLTLLRLNEEHEVAVIEMGANHPGEIDALVHIVSPDYGLITNVGSAHLEGFGSFEGVVKTKTELYRYLGKHDGTVFISSEDTLLQSHATELKKILYGVSETANYRGELDDKSLFVSFSFTVNGNSYPVNTQLIGGYNFYNLMAAVAVGSTLAVAPEQIVNALESYTPTNNRSQFQDTGKNKLIIDAYNANPSSMKVAIENLKQIDAPFKAVILGDMRELGQASAEEHRKVVELLNAAQFDKVWLCGTEFANTNSQFLSFPTIDLLKAALIENPINGYTILIKGSRGMKLEQILDIL